ncbi:MAG: UDP-N-acetylglucosamine 1-carboxyvinyltransferase [Bacilli bacterium]|nr:UDP-N-acetylglucosamine 1-carboxyvinyltransferase [Bacilli bacterium]MDD4282334.1 UDP-N-acetylglucosamine 1-carboxyvinyltransferase [Bacilli bacterium]MDD4718338.1 UDP-N-acetylglucosamine 1-carboxyvinyltransferase [Bacilli bacterium]
MKQIEIEGGHLLEGTINISGAKNSAVALVPAALLSDDIVVINNIPNISDIDALNEILVYLGAEVSRENDTIKINSRNIVNREIPENISKKLRASYYFMSALLGKYKRVEMFFPGGCSIGARPIDQTLKGFKALGATVIEKDNKFTIFADKLIGGHVYLDMPSVGATINTILAAVKAEGETIIENAAKEPEIVNVAIFLNNMGAKITGAGTSEIRIVGVNKLGKGFVEVIPDRIEAGTYIIAGALMGKNLKINNIIPEHIDSLILKLKEMGVDMDIHENHLSISKTDNMKPVNIKTIGYPGFPTDLQQPLTTLLSQCSGTSYLEETIYENRFQNIPYLRNMGASIEQLDMRHIKINGPISLTGMTVEATDLRAGACLVLAGLISNGKTFINKSEHILRGYENIVDKLNNVGAKIRINEI